MRGFGSPLRRACLSAFLLASTALVLPVAPVQAQDATAHSREFSIPGGPLATALNRFADSSGLQLVYDSGITQGLSVAALSGRMSTDAALRRLLDGTGITYRFTNASTVTLEKAPSDGAMLLTPVTVEAKSPVPPQSEIGNLPPAYAGGQVARGARLGMLGNRDIMDTPFNQTAFTSELIQNQQARTVAQVLENDPSVRFTTTGGHTKEQFRIRGFDLTDQDIALNGLYGVVPDGHVPTELIERVELLKGPNALLNGAAPSGGASSSSGVGGAVNLVLKRATDTPVNTVTFDYTSNMQLGTHLDVGRRYGENNRFGIRTNLAYRQGETEIDGQSKEHQLGAVALDYRGERLRLSLDSFAIKDTNDDGSPTAIGFDTASVTRIPSAPDGHNNLYRGATGRQDSYGAMTRAEYDITDNLTAHVAVGGRFNEYSGLITSTQVVDANGAGVIPGYGLRAMNQNGNARTITAETGLRGHFETGPVGHEVSAVVSTLSNREQMVWMRSSQSGSIYSTQSPAVPANDKEPVLANESAMTSMALSDTLSFLDDKVLLTLGGRQQYIDYKTFEDNGNSADLGKQTSSFRDSATTPAVAVVVKPFPVPVSLYGNYIEGLTQGGRVSDTSAANYGQVFAPYKTKQQEVGVKWDAGNIANTLSLFRITKPSLNRNATTHVHSQADQINQGLEWNTFGEVAEGVRLLGGVTYMRSELKKTAGGQYDGNEAIGVPRWQSNIGAEWDPSLLPGLTLEGRATYTGKQYVTSSNTQEIPSWWRFDLGARYAVQVREQDVTLRANVYNVMDRNYWAGVFSDGYITLSTPRTFMLSASVAF